MAISPKYLTVVGFVCWPTGVFFFGIEVFERIFQRQKLETRPLRGKSGTSDVAKSIYVKTIQSERFDES